MKSLQENEANRFCFTLAFRLPGKVKVSESRIKKVEVNGACKHCRYEQIWLNSLRAMSNIKVFTMQNGRPASRTNTTHYIESIYYYMIGIWKKNEQRPMLFDLHATLGYSQVQQLHNGVYSGKNKMNSII